MSQEERFQEVLNQLKKAGYRITEQRKLLLHIILNNEYSSCKEIYYAAKKQDDKVGICNCVSYCTAVGRYGTDP